jgi:tetratricopeptide (TPR) repeat protein
VRASPDFLPGVFYLGACYAAGGNARQAVGAWRTRIIGDDPLPEVYQLVADSYLRLGEGDEAANLLQEAGSRWPDDPRFGITSALARAANGHVTEALAGLKPVLDGAAPGKQTLGLAVRLAAASMATADDQAGAEATLRALTSKLRLRGRHASAGHAVARVSGQTVGSGSEGSGFWGYWGDGSPTTRA